MYKDYINDINSNNKNAYINSKYFIKIIKPFNFNDNNAYIDFKYFIRIIKPFNFLLIIFLEV